MTNIIFYQTKTKFTNTGDALINKGLIDTLRDYGKLIANDRIPTGFLTDLNLQEDEFLSSNSKFGFTTTVIFFGLRSIFSNQKIYIFSGLGHNYGGSYKKVIRNILSGLLFPILRCFGVKIIRIGISIGPITKLLGVTEVLRSIFINRYFVRDTKSLQLCHSIGIKKAELCPDLSWAYTVQNNYDTTAPGNTIVVNLRNATLDEYVTDVYINKLLEGLSKILVSFKSLLGPEMRVRVIYQVEEDKSFAEHIYNKLKTTYHTDYFAEQLTLKAAYDYYGNSLITISNRMHSVLFAYKYNSLPIALIDKKEHVKITATFIDSNIEEVVFDINESNDDIIARVSRILQNRSSFLNKIKAVEKANRQEIKSKLTEVFK